MQTEESQERWLTPVAFLARHSKLIGRNTLYERIKDKTIPSIRVGRKILIPVDALDRMLAKTGSHQVESL